jgi:hypothetical protein
MMAKKNRYFDQKVPNALKLGEILYNQRGNEFSKT